MTPELTQIPVAHVTLFLSDFTEAETEAGLQAFPSYLFRYTLSESSLRNVYCIQI